MTTKLGQSNMHYSMFLRKNRHAKPFSKLTVCKLILLDPHPSQDFLLSQRSAVPDPICFLIPLGASQRFCSIGRIPPYLYLNGFPPFGNWLESWGADVLLVRGNETKAGRIQRLKLCPWVTSYKDTYELCSSAFITLAWNLHWNAVHWLFHMSTWLF